MKNEVRLIDANALARKIREYMRSLPASTAGIMEYHKVLSMLRDEGQTPTISLKKCDKNETEIRPSFISGKPLTLEQLRGIDGQPVWVEAGNQFSDWGKVDLKRGRIWPFGTAEEWWDFRHYGDWVPYAYPPSHIDREAWDPCHACKSKQCFNCWNDDLSMNTEPCRSCTGNEWRAKYKFCPECGRPMTEEAWAELEKKFKGEK